jgi:PEP-CTERM motif
MFVIKKTVTESYRHSPISAILGATAVVAALTSFGPFDTRPARAGLIIQALNSTAAPGGTGAFDVIIIDNGGSFNVAGFSVELSVPAGSVISFSDVTTDTLAATYLFGTLQSQPFTFDTFPNQDFSAGDFTATAPGFVTLMDGDEFGLAHVTYAVDSGAPAGPVALSLVPTGTSLSDENGDGVSFTTSNGTITVSGPTVPEPSSLVLAGLGAALLVLFHRLSRRAVLGAVGRD